MNKKLSLFLLIISVGLLTALAAGTVFGSGEDGLKKADEARQKHTAALLAKPGVVAVAVGFNPAGEAAVKVYTEDAEVGGIPTKLDGVPVHKQVSGKIMANRPGTAPGLAPMSLLTTDRWPRPVPIGVSTGHPDITACTIGARVIGGGKVYAMSNNHCYADENNAGIGDAAIQPGTYDGGVDPDDRIGTLAAFKEIHFGNFGKCLMRGKQCNYMDAAIAETSTGNVGNSTPVDGYGTPSSTIAAPSVGMPVQKYGRTTGPQDGTIDSINAAVRVGYSSGNATFVDQFIINSTTFSAGGDSGSLILTQYGNYPVGLLFAGSSSTTIGSPIGPILNEFGVSIDGPSGGGSGPTPTPDPATPTPTPTPTPDPTPTPTPAPPGADNMGVYEISWNSKKRNLAFTVNIRQDSDANSSLTSGDSTVESARVLATLCHIGGTCWSNFGGYTDGNGNITFKLVGGAPMGDYQAEVTGLTHSPNPDWAPGLDEDNPATFTR